MTHELNSYRDERWYIEQANMAANMAYARDDTEQAFVHRAIAMNIYARRLRAISAVNAASVNLIQDRTEQSSLSGFKKLGDFANDVAALPEVNDFVAVRTQYIDGNNELECMIGDIQLRFDTVNVEDGFKISIALLARHTLMTTNEEWSRTNRNVLETRTEAHSDGIIHTIPIQPPTDIMLIAGNGFEKTLKSNHYDSKKPSALLEAVWSERNRIDWTKLSTHHNTVADGSK